MSIEFKQRTLDKGITYKQYIDDWSSYLDKTDPNQLSESEKNFFDYRKLNFQRSSRIQKTYSIDGKIASFLDKIQEPQVWMVLTENWCGDSAQSLPYLAAIAETSDKIELRILYRDENIDIMDNYLTNGKSRSIPKLVAFDSEGNELFQWGPRPKLAQQFLEDELQKGKDKQSVYQDLHLWYNRDKGKTIESEIVNLLETVTNNQPGQ